MQKLYDPLGMSSTSSSYADFLTRANRATLHFNDQGTFKALYIRDADAQSPADRSAHPLERGRRQLR